MTVERNGAVPLPFTVYAGCSLGAVSCLHSLRCGIAGQMRGELCDGVVSATAQVFIIRTQSASCWS